MKCRVLGIELSGEYCSDAHRYCVSEYFDHCYIRALGKCKKFTKDGNPR